MGLIRQVLKIPLNNIDHNHTYGLSFEKENITLSTSERNFIVGSSTSPKKRIWGTKMRRCENNFKLYSSHQNAKLWHQDWKKHTSFLIPFILKEKKLGIEIK